ncbi:MAG: 50S ribosomal protein L3 [Bacteroidetes bacterium]|nr:50S ribosomal protein L3 [Bacteroidota bacterium]
MPGLIGKKIGMTSFYNEMGRNVACTVLDVSPNYVTQVKTNEKDGYSAVQLAYGTAKEKNTTKAMKGHYNKAGVAVAEVLKEFQEMDENLSVGDTVDINQFKVGDLVEITGVSKGKGFQGVVKRHGFGGVGQSTHGQHNRLRAPGSIGACSTPSRVFKGMRMAGRMGNDRITVFNLRVVKMVPEKNLLIVRGAVPGHNGSNVLIQL